MISSVRGAALAGAALCSSVYCDCTPARDLDQAL
jgi:hypothetical protein